MKKTYVKPMIQFEDFKISTNIAGDCKYDAQFSADSCAYVDSLGTYYFTSEFNGCKTTPVGDEYSFCYHNPGDNNIFGS